MAPKEMRAEIQKRLEQKPFQPFRVCLPGGTSYEIRYPKLTILGQVAFVIGVTSADQQNPEYADYSVSVRFVEIKSIEPLTLTTAGR